MQGCLNICKPVCVIYVKRMKNKNRIIISIDAEKVFDQIQHPFKIKTLNKLVTETMLINIMKVIYDKHTANIIF